MAEVKKSSSKTHICRETPEHSESLSHHASPRESPSERGGSVESSIESLSDFDRVILLEQTDSLRELHTILRDQNTTNSDYIFSADRLIRLVVEEGLNHLPYYRRSVITPDNANFDGIKFARGNCAIALSRSGEAMEFAVRQCCRNTTNSDYIFSADRLIRLVVEEGLNHLPYYRRSVITPDNANFDGIKFARGNCAIALSRSGEAMEFAVRQCCRSIRIGIRRVHKEFPMVTVITSEINDDVPYYFTMRYFGTD
uniref:Uncharacterized protein n=1 Tax=Panagrolaimus sp. ES5 TaxID=591445 RepID=A0AC34F4X5_9BILA